MKDTILNIIHKYLEIFPEETEIQSKLIKYLESHDIEEITNWNNFDGHIVAGGFIYSLKEKKFLLLHHKDLNMYLYPGGHIDSNDADPLVAVKREIEEETGLKDLKQLKIIDDQLIPIDIDTHIIGRNDRLNLREHYHFDFRYLFLIDRIENIKLDTEELANYKWIEIDELHRDSNYKNIAAKIEKLLLKNKTKRRNKMNLEFAGRFNKSELILKEFKHWVIIVRENVVTLGSCIIILKSGKPFLKDVSAEEMAEFAEVCKWFEEKTKKLFGAEKWNYLALMMKDEFVHFHAIPRYSKELNYYDRTWSDNDWPKATSLSKIEIDYDTLMKIKNDMLD